MQLALSQKLARTGSITGSVTDDFRYPGNDVTRYQRLLGLLVSAVGYRVVVRPEQWEHRRSYGVTHNSWLRHYLEFVVYKPDDSIAFSYRDFVFGIQNDHLSSTEQESTKLIVLKAELVAANLRSLFPKVPVEVVLDEE